MPARNPPKTLETANSVQLELGSTLQNYKLRKIIGLGGFSVVYLAKNKQTGKVVAIKEFYSPTCCKRLSNNSVRPISVKHARKFKLGSKRFFDVSFTLSQINHPNIIHVDNFFRANNTAYIVMPYEMGKDLRWFIKQTKDSPSEIFLLNVFLMVLAGLKGVHEQGFLHLDIKPSKMLTAA